MAFKPNYKQFYQLLKGMPYVSKEELVKQYTNDRTTHISGMRSDEYFTMLFDMQNSNLETNKELDKERKKVIAAIGGFFKATNKKHDINIIKGTACRAACCKDFNKIPISKLRGIYSEFSNQEKAIKNSRLLTQKEIKDLALKN